MIFCEKILAKIKISLHRSVEKLGSHKRYFCLFVCLGAFISEIELPRIPTYLLNMRDFACKKKSSFCCSKICLNFKRVIFMFDCIKHICFKCCQVLFAGRFFYFFQQFFNAVSVNTPSLIRPTMISSPLLLVGEVIRL